MTGYELNLRKYTDLVDSIHLSKDSGKVTEVTGMMVKGFLPGASVGSICRITPTGTEKHFLAEVVGFKDQSVLMMPLHEMRGVGLGSRITLVQQSALVRVSDALLGRVVNGLGQTIDGGEPIEFSREVPLYSEVRNPLERRPIRQSLDLGVRAINAALTIGQGQRIGIMAGSGVGKSVLMGMMARNSKADVNVIALIGERGREVREFIENDLGAEGMARSVVVCVTNRRCCACGARSSRPRWRNTSRPKVKTSS